MPKNMGSVPPFFKTTTFIASLNPNRTAISVITYAEILVGFEEETAREVKALLNHYHLLSIDEPIAERAAPNISPTRLLSLSGERRLKNEVRELKPSPRSFNQKVACPLFQPLSLKIEPSPFRLS